MTTKIIVISGPTASRKSRLAQEISEHYPELCIINADSMQIYKELPILTAQPTEYISAFKHNYYLYGILDYTQNFSVVAWINSVETVMKEIWSINKIPLIVGGTGLYIKSLIHGLSNIPNISPEIRMQIHNLFEQIGIDKFYKLLCSLDPFITTKIHNNDKYRMIRALEVFKQTGKSITEFYNDKKQNVDFDFQHINLQPSRTLLYDTCNQRFAQMIKLGALDEVLNFSTKTGSSTSSLSRSLGYNYLCKYLNNELSKEDSIELSQIQTRQYAKRQVTWFKNQSPEATHIQSEKYTDAYKQALSLIGKFIR